VFIVTTPKTLSTLLMVEQSSMKTSTDRAAEAIEAAELLFIKQMSTTLNRSPAAKGP
jgi:hypothetical protein